MALRSTHAVSNDAAKNALVAVFGGFTKCYPIYGDLQLDTYIISAPRRTMGLLSQSPGLLVLLCGVDSFDFIIDLAYSLAR